MSFFSLNELKTIQVILDSRSKAGDGTDENPYRSIVNVFTTGGELIATNDHFVNNMINDYYRNLHKQRNKKISDEPKEFSLDEIHMQIDNKALSITMHLDQWNKIKLYVESLEKQLKEKE
jgi:hypothetical protein